MHVSTLQLQLHIPGCRSLKEKRRHLRPLLNRLRRDFNISVAEVDKQDLHQTAALGVASVGNDRAFLNAVLAKVVERVERESALYLQDWVMEER
jgi:uncharacterized protein YlxP (DUF503 family)